MDLFISPFLDLIRFMTNSLTTHPACCSGKRLTAAREPFDEWVSSVVTICAVAALAVGIQNLLAAPKSGDRPVTLEKSILVERPLPSQGKDGRF
jgi:hypothetical protein